MGVVGSLTCALSKTPVKSFALGSWPPQPGLLARFTVPDVASHLHNRPQIQSESSWVLHDSCATIEPVSTTGLTGQ